jgi:hypothetical protein
MNMPDDRVRLIVQSRIREVLGYTIECNADDRPVTELRHTPRWHHRGTGSAGIISAAEKQDAD